MVNIHGHGILILPGSEEIGIQVVCPVHKTELEIFNGGAASGQSGRARHCPKCGEFLVEYTTEQELSAEISKAIERSGRK